MRPLAGLIDLPEPELVGKLIEEWPTLYHFFDFVVSPAIGEPRDRGEWSYVFAANVPREMLGMKAGMQPGDIDALIVPVRNGEPRPELAGAVEVKRLALKGPNWTKNVDRYGIKQARGLLAAGFPFVGLLHIVVSSEGPSEFHRPVRIAQVTNPQQGFVEFLGDQVHDLTGFDAAERQYRRLFAQELDPAMGINCVAVAEVETEPGKFAAYTSLTPGRQATRNPRINPQLVANIGHLAKFGHEYSPLRNFDRRKEMKG